MSPDSQHEAQDAYTLSRAADLARAGHHAAAEQALAPLLERPAPARAAWDLMARVCAQQGRWAEAAAWWRRLLAVDPQNAAARAGLDCLERLQRRALRLGPWRSVVLGAGVGILALGLLFLAMRALHQRDRFLALPLEAAIARQESSVQRQIESLAGRIEDLRNLAAPALAPAVATNPATPVSPDRLETLEQHVARLVADAGLLRDRAALIDARLARLTSTQEENARTLERYWQEFLARSTPPAAPSPPAAPAPAAALPAPAPALRAPPVLTEIAAGVRIQAESEWLVITFDEELFEHGVRFRPSGRKLLESTAFALARTGSPLDIEVIGWDKAGPSPRSGVASPEAYRIGLQRAAAVADLLRTQALVPAERIRISGRSEAGLPSATGPHAPAAGIGPILLRVRTAP